MFKMFGLTQRRVIGKGCQSWAGSHNNSLERFNLFVKESYTCRKRLSLPLLFQSIELMLKEWSFENDENLFKPRLSILESEIGLSLKSAGYDWIKLNDNPGQILKIPPGNHMVVASSKYHNKHNRDAVKALLIVSSSEAGLKGEELKKNCKRCNEEEG